METDGSKKLPVSVKIKLNNEDKALVDYNPNKKLLCDIANETCIETIFSKKSTFSFEVNHCNNKSKTNLSVRYQMVLELNNVPKKMKLAWKLIQGKNHQSVLE